MTKVSSHDIAKLAGVSQSTVSRVINNNPRITEETREKVFAAMRELGYTPNAAARTLITGRSHLIGLVVSNIANPFYPLVIEGIVASAEEHDYNVILGNTQESPRRQMDYLKLLVEHQVDGVILTSALASSRDTLEHFRRGGTPLVLVNRVLDGSNVDSVHIDNRHGGYRATSHLISLGRRRIAYAGGRPDSSTHQHRYEGYRQAMAEAGLAIDKTLVTSGDFTQLSGTISAHHLLAVPERPDAVVCSDDLIALGLIDALLGAGVDVPDDIAVVGFDDIPLASLRQIGLTTVRQPAAELGQRAFQLLLRRLEGQEVDADPVEEVLPAELVVRSTCGAGAPAQ